MAPVICSGCGEKPATCIGICHCDGPDTPQPMCDDCCGHGQEDSTCWPIDEKTCPAPDGGPPETKECST